MSTKSEYESQFLCRMDYLSCALRAALKVAGKKDYAYVRLRRISANTLAVSSVSEKTTFSASLHADFIRWDDDRDYVVDITKAVAASLAGFDIKIRPGLEVDPLVSIAIGDETIKVRDETGLFPVSRGRTEIRETDAVLPGDHQSALAKTSTWSGSPFVIPPEEFGIIASVAKALDKPIQLMQRLVSLTAVRWYVVGPGWQLSVSATPEKRTESDEPDDADAATNTTEDNTAETNTPDSDVKVVRATRSEFAPA